MGAIIMFISGETIAGSPALTQSLCFIFLLFHCLSHRFPASSSSLPLAKTSRLNDMFSIKGKKRFEIPKWASVMSFLVVEIKMCSSVMKQVDCKRGMKYFMMCLWRRKGMSYWTLCPSMHCGFHPHAIHTWFRVFVAGEASPLRPES